MIVFVLAVIIIIIIIIIIDLIVCFFLCCAAGHRVSIHRLEQHFFLHKLKQMIYSYVLPNFCDVFKSNYESKLATVSLLK
jgi:hypothetical protein